MSTADADTLAAALAAVTDQHGRTLAELSAERPVLVLCVRHTGCTFCREALADLSAARKALADAGIGVAIVHMSPDPVAAALCDKYGLGDASRFADPERRVYAALSLPEGGPRELLSPRVWVRGYSAAIAAGHGFGKIIGSLRQLAGAAVIFLVQNMLTLFNVSQVWLNLVFGALLLFAVITGSVIAAPRKEGKQ